MVLQPFVFLVGLSKQKFELEGLVGFIFAFDLGALGGVFESALVVLKRESVLLLGFDPFLPPIFDLLLSGDPLLVGRQQLAIQIVELFLQEHLALCGLAIDPRVFYFLLQSILQHLHLHIQPQILHKLIATSCLSTFFCCMS